MLQFEIQFALALNYMTHKIEKTLNNTNTKIANQQ